MDNESETQLDRIEAKLDELMIMRDMLLKLAMPRIPPAMRAQVMKMAGKP
jgi:hypothetical protein